MPKAIWDDRKYSCSVHPSKFQSPPCDAMCRPLKVELQDLLGSVAKGCSSCCLHQEWGMAGLPSMLSTFLSIHLSPAGHPWALEKLVTRIRQGFSSVQHRARTGIRGSSPTWTLLDPGCSSSPAGDGCSTGDSGLCCVMLLHQYLMELQNLCSQGSVGGSEPARSEMGSASGSRTLEKFSRIPRTECGGVGIAC